MVGRMEDGGGPTLFADFAILALFSLLEVVVVVVVVIVALLLCWLVASVLDISRSITDALSVW